MKVNKYDFMFQKHYTGITRVKLLMFAKNGRVHTFEKIVSDEALINRIQSSKYPDYEDLLKLKRLVKE
jgi:hypothetical protein